MCVFGILLILACHGFNNAWADTEFRRVYELNRDYLPDRFKKLGLHGHMDFFATDDSKRPLYIPSDVTSEGCRNHSRIYSDAIENYKIWALRMLDASGRVPSGLLNGHFMDLGNYEECMSSAGVAPYDVNYCVVVMRNLTKTPKSPIDWDSEDRKYTMGGAPFLRPYLRIGICLPAICDLKDLTQHYSNVTSKYNMTVWFDNHSCTSSNKRQKLEKLDLFAIILIITLGTLCFLGTLNDVLRIYFNCKTNGTLMDILQCFSFYENGKSILKTTSPDRSLAILHGLRALSAFWIVMAHHIYLGHIFPVVNNIQLTTFPWTVLSDPFLQSELAVDTFLLLNGLLLVYSTIKSKSSNKKFNVPLFYLHHVFRIVPAYFMQLLINLTLYRLLNDGPLWKHYIYTIRESCQQSWWAHVIFLNNYLSPDKQCVPSAWYLAVHMQLVLVSPLLLIPIFKGKKIVPFVIVPALFVIANIVSISITYFNDYPGTFFVDRLAAREDIFGTDYVPTHARISPWLLGILVGYFLSQESLKISKMQAVSGWILSIFPFAIIFAISRHIHSEGVPHNLFLSSMHNGLNNTAWAILIGWIIMQAVSGWILSIFPFAIIFAISRHIHSEGVPHNLFLSSIHNGLNNTAWAILIGWIIVACETGYAGPLKSFLTWTAFQPISKLSYTIYLIGLGVQYGLISLRQTSYSMLLIQAYKDFGGELFLILIFSPIYCLLFEAPFMKLYQMLMKNVQDKQKFDSAKNRVDIEEMKKMDDCKQIELPC